MQFFFSNKSSVVTGKSDKEMAAVVWYFPFDWHKMKIKYFQSLTEFFKLDAYETEISTGASQASLCAWICVRAGLAVLRSKDFLIGDKVSGLSSYTLLNSGESCKPTHMIRAETRLGTFKFIEGDSERNKAKILNWKNLIGGTPPLPDA